MVGDKRRGHTGNTWVPRNDLHSNDLDRMKITYTSISLEITTVYKVGFASYLHTRALVLHNQNYCLIYVKFHK